MNSLLEEDKRKKWEIHINSFLISTNRISVKLVRTSVIRSVFTEVSDCQLSYGITNIFNGKVSGYLNIKQGFARLLQLLNSMIINL